MRRGMNFTIGSMEWMEGQTAKAPKEAFPGELAMNGIEAGGEVDIMANEDGMVTVVDNGSGMLPGTMIAKLRGLGFSTKTIGPDANLGVGAKFFIRSSSPQGARWISRHRDSPGGRWFLYEIGPGEDEEGQKTFGPIIQSNGQLTTAVPRPQMATGQYGTVVEALSLKFDGAAMLRFFNNRFLKPPKPIRVHRRQGAKPDEVPGLLECLERICMEGKFGKVELKHADVYWGVKRPEDELKHERFQRWNFDPRPLNYAWKGLVFRSWPSSDSYRKLAQWGIMYGASRVILIVVAKDPPGTPEEKRIMPSAERFGIENWAESKAQDEWEKEFPEELRLWLQSLQKGAWAQPERELVQELLDITFGLKDALPKGGKLKVGRPKSQEIGTPRRGTGGGGGSGRGGSRRELHRVDYHFDESGDMEGRRLELRGDVVWINLESEGIASILKKAGHSLVKLKRIRAAIATEAVANMTNFLRSQGKEETSEEEALRGAIRSIPFILARYYASAKEGRMHMPMEGISIAD